MEINAELIAVVVTALLTLIGFFGAKYLRKIKTTLEFIAGDLYAALDESFDPVKAFRDAVADGRVSSDEVENVLKEVNEAKGAWEKVFVKFRKNDNGEIETE